MQVGSITCRCLALVSLLGGVVIIPAPRALALDPARALTQYQRRTWGAENGLTTTEVLSVTQGSDGYLWLGTAEGVVRFDGVRCKVFDRKSDPSADHCLVYTVREDSRRPGELVLSTSGGACRLVDGKIQPFPSTASPAARQPGNLVFQDPADGSSWFRSVRGMVRIDEDGKVTGPLEGTPGWPTEKIRTVCRDQAGRFWLGTGHGLYRQHGDALDPRDPRFDLLPGWEGKVVDRLLSARSGGIWIGSLDAGIVRLAPDGASRAYPTLAGNVVRALLEDRAGMLWVGTDNGLFRLPVSEDPGAAPSPAELTAENGLVDNSVMDLCEDREGNLWIATQGGLEVLKDTRFLNYGRPEGLAGDNVLSVLEDQRGRLWIGNENGLGMLTPGAERATNYSLPPSSLRQSNTVFCLASGEDDDTLLVGTSAGLVRWSAGNGERLRSRDGTLELLPLRDDVDHRTVYALCRDTAGNLWVGADGVYQVRDGKVVAHLTSADGLAGGRAFALLVDRHGNLWIGTGGGLSRRAPDGKITTFPNSGSSRLEGTVTSIFEEPTSGGDLFVGTYSGLHRLHFAADGGVQINRYTEREGLSTNAVWGILEDLQGLLWIADDKGVTRVAPADFARFDRGEIPSIPQVTYGVADGMRSQEGSTGEQPAACRDRLGRLWFATTKGAAMADPAHVVVDSVPPRVYVEELFADGKVVPAAAKKAMGGGEDAPPCALSPGTQKLDFRYTALALTNPEANRFRYWLEGFDADWTEAGTERAAHYTNLPPGDYRFHVQAVNSNGVWNKQGATLAFHLRPFFYQTAWFRALVAGFALVLLGLLQHGLRRRWQRRLADAEARLRERERTAEILRQSKEQAEHAHQVAEQARKDAEAAQGEAEVARAEAERANAAKSGFLSRMSHELRTPLNAILGFGQVLEMGKVEGNQAQCVQYILKAGRHLLSLVDELLDLSRVEAGAPQLRLTEFSIQRVAEECIGLVTSLAAARSVQCELKPPARWRQVKADEQRVRQVLLNLLSNAIKYNREGGRVVVSMTEVDQERTLRIDVTDTGAGISAGDLERLFVPFSRLDHDFGPVEGTGLGLVVSRHIVEAMGGRLGVHSTVGEGSTFWFELPLAAPPLAAHPEGPGPTENKSMTTLPSTPEVTILYIEDIPSNVMLVEMLLNAQRPTWCLLSESNGRSGMHTLRTSSPDVLLLDLQLPGMQGDEVLAEIRRDTNLDELPVIVVTADATAVTHERLTVLGADDCVAKPFRCEDLLEKIERVLETKRG